MRLATLAALALLLATPALAQTPDDDFHFDRDCMDEYGRDLCDPAVWGDIVTRFGLAPAEAEQAKGQRGVRVFTIDGYSNDLPVVSVLAGSVDEHSYLLQPTLTVSGQRPRNIAAGAAPMLTRPAWSSLTWFVRDMQDLAAAAPVRQSEATPPRPPVMPVEKSGRDIVVVTSCKHAWVTVIESLTKTGVVRRIRNACDHDPLYEASIVIPAQALRGFPHCNHIDPASQRIESTQLQSCLKLEGEDRIAAAEVLSLIDGDMFWKSETFLPHIASNARLIRPDGAIVTGPEAIARTLDELPLFGRFFEQTRVTGSADRVTASGLHSRYTEDDRHEQARIDQTWRRQSNSWRLTEITIGPFKLVEY